MAQKRNQTALKAILVTIIIVIVLLGMIGSGLFTGAPAAAPVDQSQPAPDFGVEVGASGPIQVTTEPTP